MFRQNKNFKCSELPIQEKQPKCIGCWLEKFTLYIAVLSKLFPLHLLKENKNVKFTATKRKCDIF